MLVPLTNLPSLQCNPNPIGALFVEEELSVESGARTSALSQTSQMLNVGKRRI